MTAGEVRQRQIDAALGQFDSQLPDWLARVLIARGIYSDSDIGSQLSDLLHPEELSGIGKAVDLLEHHLRQQNSILILGDYDADGATSCALMVRVLRAMGARQVNFLVPNRFDYGYGLTPEIVEVAASQSPDLIITVDNGIASIEGVDAANVLGVEVLITDHHLPASELPLASAIVNPNQLGCEFPSKNLAGVGVAFYLLSALRKRLRDTRWFEEKNIPEPRLANWLDLVALGTVADVVPLDKNNRVLVKAGIALMRSGQGNAGIRSLFSVSGRDWRQATSADLGFAIGPRINAAGRLDDISLGVQCLLTEDKVEARSLAAQLQDINRDRRAIEEQMQIESDVILHELEASESEMPWGLSLFQESWHQGVVGLLASRVKERFHRPVVAFARENPGTLKGSGRSIPGFHMRDALDLVATANPGLITKFGGHAMAAGLSLPEENLDRFTQAFDQVVRQQLSEAELQAVVWTDGELPSDALSLENARLLRDFLPWGQKCPEPQFEGEFDIVSRRVVGEKHLRLDLNTADGKYVQAIWFNADFDALEQGGSIRRIIYRIGINDYRGEQLQLQVVHLD